MYRYATAADVVGTPPNLARIDTTTPSPSTCGGGGTHVGGSDGVVNIGEGLSEGSREGLEHSHGSPAFATLMRKVSATRSSLAAALAAAEERKLESSVVVPVQAE